MYAIRSYYAINGGIITGCICSWPALTTSPSLTATETNRPGIGESRNLDRSGGAFSGMYSYNFV